MHSCTNRWCFVQGNLHVRRNSGFVQLFTFLYKCVYMHLLRQVRPNVWNVVNAASGIFEISSLGYLGQMNIFNWIFGIFEISSPGYLGHLKYLQQDVSDMWNIFSRVYGILATPSTGCLGYLKYLHGLSGIVKVSSAGRLGYLKYLQQRILDIRNIFNRASGIIDESSTAYPWYLK